MSWTLCVFVHLTKCGLKHFFFIYYFGFNSNNNVLYRQKYFFLYIQELINGLKDFTPLLKLSPKKSREELVEISDSESEGEVEMDDKNELIIGEDGAK